MIYCTDVYVFLLFCFFTWRPKLRVNAIILTWTYVYRKNSVQRLYQRRFYNRLENFWQQKMRNNQNWTREHVFLAIKVLFCRINMASCKTPERESLLSTPLWRNNIRYDWSTTVQLCSEDFTLAYWWYDTNYS